MSSQNGMKPLVVYRTRVEWWRRLGIVGITERGSNMTSAKPLLKSSANRKKAPSTSTGGVPKEG